MGGWKHRLKRRLSFGDFLEYLFVAFLLSISIFIIYLEWKILFYGSSSSSYFWRILLISLGFILAVSILMNLFTRDREEENLFQPFDFERFFDLDSVERYFGRKKIFPSRTSISRRNREILKSYRIGRS